ncbi:MAG: hypothetical protein LKJ57_05355 [Ancrocorticia sp.]|jgi:hypothetical protein|nr:hypothetical protein [Ancrocorticia sp.]MCI1896174.1 hypothetical protein [Ancrocorticia sp.]MCI1932881.1 hypothetical protein [Ancrocorticia sp.]MCI1963199.1 hypothetical protein [Ancrocorticia sp.]MCI2013009.1 hypothetical protein [Ancrocorticia sp.]
MTTAKQRVPNTLTYLGLIAWVVGMCALAIYIGPVTAVYGTGISLLIFAVLRAVLPVGTVPGARGRWFDAVLLVLGAAALFLLAPIAATPMSL